MKPRWMWLVFGLLITGTIVGYWQASLAIRELVQRPFTFMFLSDISLTGRLLEVSSNVEVVQNASRQLVQPWGALRVKKVFPTSDNAPTTSPNDESAQRTDLRNP